jgi:hypothetical protein
MKRTTTIERRGTADIALQSMLIRASISLLAIGALVFRYSKELRDFNNSDLILIGIALVPWIGEFVSSVSWGKDKTINFNDRLDRVERTAAAALDAGLRGTIKAPAASKARTAGAAITKASEANDDPEKGKWGGTPTSGGRQLTAEIQRIPGEDLYRRVILTVRSIDDKKPLMGRVTFHLHPTFDQPVFDEPVFNGEATTSLVSYGAFTVGAEVDKGRTRLELDLASLDDAKDQFFKR